MTPTFLFELIITILVLEFFFDKYLDYLNAKHFKDPVPKLIDDVYDEKEYLKSQNYKKENYQFSFWTSIFSLVVLLLFFYFKGFAWIDEFARSFSSNQIVVGLIFFGVIMLANDILTTPFSYYQTFVIEEKYGFNKSTPKLFFLDKLKGWFLSILLGGSILALIIYFYQITGEYFWIFTWLLITLFTLFFTFFYSSIIVPLFNKQTPLEEGSLRSKIDAFAQKTGFTLDNIFVIDGSKRSTKANAYFAGFGSKKRIVLYDTLIEDLNEDEIVAVLAHEIGHYKKKHVIYNMILSTLITGLTLYILSLLIGNPILAEALSVKIPSFHIGLIAFGLLFSPISEITGIAMQYMSRQFEFEADDFAKFHHNGNDLISSLKKLSRKSLSNLTPHKAYVFFHYSHPPLLERVQNLLA
ncbi:M48 family metallopeptidase [Namhaeicola litoreus]|uniref:M48 family metallopeptidase n=1 Tax=Namhaeicola litoreus TaxID=1052145 RepID=A0ABW3Y7F5_9FLAO